MFFGGVACTLTHPHLRMLVTTSLTDLTVAHGQWGSVVVDHQAVQLITGTLLAHVVAAQFPELGQLLVGDFNRCLEYDPDDRLEEWRGGQGAQVRPVGLRLWQEAARIQAIGNCHAIVLVRHEWQQFHNLVECLVVLSTLK